VNYGHGGVDSANLVEWGGYNVGGSVWGWDTNRPVAQWGSQPIGEMMADNGVTAFFHGHDHQYAYEKLDDMVYQAVPSASFTGNFGIYTTGGNGGNTIQALTSTGHLRVTVGSDETTVEYMRTGQTTSAYTYTMEPNVPPTFTLTTTAGVGGTITAPPTSPTTHSAGAVVTITAAPNTGYHFVNWTGDVGTVANVNATSTTITMNGNYAITANFAINTYTLTYTAGAGGTITAPPISPTTHDHGTVVTITAAPNTGYHFVNWTGDVSTVADVNAASTTITMNGNYAITANFAINTYTLTAGNDGHGTVTLNPAGGTYASGTTVTLIPVPSAGYLFSSWSGANAADIVNTGGVYTIVMNGNKSVIANFFKNILYIYLPIVLR
jgi:hypothetical protein